MANKNKEPEQTGIENLDASLTSFSGKVEKNKKVIIGAVIGIIVIAGAIFGYIFYRNHLNKESAKEFSGAYVKAFEAGSKSQAENQDSVMNALLAKEMSAVAKSEEGKTGATLANIELARIYYSNGKAKEALDAIEAADIDEPIMAMNAMVFKGDCYVDLNKYSEAIGAYDEAFNKAKEENPELAVRALLKKARVLDAQKKYADALAIYEQILKDYPQIAENLRRPVPTQYGSSLPAMDIEAYAERERALAGK